MHLSKHLLCLVSMKGLGQWEGGTGVALRRWRRITPSPSLLRIPCWSHFLRTCQLFLPVSFHVLRIWARSIPVGRNWNLVEDMKATFELQMLGCPRETLGENLQPNHRNGMKWLRSASSTCIDRNAWPVLYHIITVYIKMCVTATLHLLYYTWKMDMLLIFNVKLGFSGWVQPQNYDSCVINASRGWCKSSAIPWVCSIPTGCGRMINPTIWCMIEYKTRAILWVHPYPLLPQGMGMTLPGFHLANARDHSLQRGHQLGIGLENRWGWNIHQFQCWPMENRLGRLPVAQRNKTCKVGGGFGWGKLMNGIDTWIVRRWQGNICREMSQCPSLFEPVLGLFRPQRVTTLWLRSQVAHPPHTWADAKL